MRFQEITARFWRLHKEEAFKHVDIALFMFLLNEWAARKKPDWFDIGTRYLEISVPISRKSLVFSREKLRQKGLIDYEPAAGSGTAKYSVCVSDCASHRNSSVSQINTKETQNGICVPDSVSVRNTNEFVFPSETQIKRKVSPTPPLKENNNNYLINNNDNNSACARERFGAMELLDIGEIVRRLKQSCEWTESMRRTLHLDERELAALLDAYPDHCTNLGETRKTLQDAKRHVYNWLLKQKSRQLQTMQNETKREDRFSERRGTAPSANSAEDYAASL